MLIILLSKYPYEICKYYLKTFQWWFTTVVIIGKFVNKFAENLDGSFKAFSFHIQGFLRLLSNFQGGRTSKGGNF